jgi:hypothetical protein
MALPKGKEKLKLITEGHKTFQAKERQRKLEEAEEQRKKTQEEAEAFRKAVDYNKEYVEQRIREELSKGQRKLKLDISERKWDKSWEVAVKELSRENREYTFSYSRIGLEENNFGEAANVDYVSPMTWTEYYMRLSIEW